MLQRAWFDLPNLLSLLVFLSVTALLFRSWEFALIVTASLGFHELGHAFALWWYRLEFRIRFGIVGAWTWSSMTERTRLPQLANTLIHLAGPAASLLLSLLALGLQTLWNPADHHLLTLANFSAQVGFLNLIPLGNLSDGGKMMRRMVSSLDGERRVIAVLLPMIVSAFMLALYTVVQLPHISSTQPSTFFLQLLLVGVWMAGSLLIETRRVSMADCSCPALMSPGQTYFLILIVWDLLVLGLVVTAITPFWLAPEYVLGSLRNVMAVLNFVARTVL